MTTQAPQQLDPQTEDLARVSVEEIDPTIYELAREHAAERFEALCQLTDEELAMQPPVLDDTTP